MPLGTGSCFSVMSLRIRFRVAAKAAVAPDICLLSTLESISGLADVYSAQACLHPEYPKTQLVDCDRDAAADAVASGAQAGVGEHIMENSMTFISAVSMPFYAGIVFRACGGRNLNQELPGGRGRAKAAVG